MRKLWLAAPALLMIYSCAGLFVAPWLLEQSLQQFTTEKLGLQLELDKARLNPFNFSAQLEQVVLRDHSGEPLFAAPRVEAGTSFLGFWGRTGQLQSLIFHEPQLYVDHHAAGRFRLKQFLSRLVNAAEALAETTWIANLNLVRAKVVVVDRSQSPQRRSDYPFFSLSTDSFGPSRTGRFQLGSDSVKDSGFQFQGDVAWAGTSASGRFDLLLKSPSAMALKSHFNVAFPEAELQLELEQARLSFDAVDWDLGQVLGVTAEQFFVDFDLSLVANHETLAMREAVVRTSAFQVQDLFGGRQATIMIPVRSAEFHLLDFAVDFAVNERRYGEFDLLLHTEPAGRIQLNGIYQPLDGDTLANFKLAEVPVAALLPAAQDMFAQTLAMDFLSADGSLLVRYSATEPGREPDSPGLVLSERLNLAMLKRGPGNYAAIELTGQMTSGAELRLLGFLNPAGSVPGSRLEVELTGLDARAVSPFTLEFSGQEPVSGALDVNLDAEVFESFLQGSYVLALQDLEFEQQNAGTIPLDQALDFPVALLQDTDNRIVLALPFDAELDAEFEFPALLENALAEHLRGIAVMPFEALAELLGIDAGYLQTVSFPPGQAGLTPEAITQLEWLKTALQWRPGLELQVSGAYDPDADQYALALQQVRLHVLLATAADPALRTNSAPIVYSDPKVQVVLDEFAGSRLGGEAVSDIKERFGLQRENPESPLSEAQLEAYYRAVFDALVAQEPINERAMLSIARYRAQAVINQLARQGIDRQRLISGDPQTVAASLLQGVPVRFALAVFNGTAPGGETPRP